ncbi:hypothetical protein BKA57DRAFT_454422 [Linnemannia elongata]|nr:hypothetical protein BKA57DRAFT_454422 [Linnemannia elongata]
MMTTLKTEKGGNQFSRSPLFFFTALRLFVSSSSLLLFFYSFFQPPTDKQATESLFDASANKESFLPVHLPQPTTTTTSDNTQLYVQPQAYTHSTTTANTATLKQQRTGWSCTAFSIRLAQFLLKPTDLHGTTSTTSTKTNSSSEKPMARIASSRRKGNHPRLSPRRPCRLTLRSLRG